MRMYSVVSIIFTLVAGLVSSFAEASVGDLGSSPREELLFQLELNPSDSLLRDFHGAAADGVELLKASNILTPDVVAMVEEIMRDTKVVSEMKQMTLEGDNPTAYNPTTKSITAHSVFTSLDPILKPYAALEIYFIAGGVDKETARRMIMTIAAKMIPGE